MQSEDQAINIAIATGCNLLQSLGYLQVLAPDPAIGEIGTYRAWKIGLKGLSAEQISAGFDHLTSTWVIEYGRKPGPGEIRRALAESSNKGWSEAWDEIQARGHLFNPGGNTFSSRHGCLVRASWSCPEIAEAVSQMGGINACLNHHEGNLSVIRSQFKDIWQSIQKRKAYRQFPALPQPPQFVSLPPAQVAALPPAFEVDESKVIDLEARRNDHIRQQQIQGAEMVRKRLAEIEARKLAEYQAKITAEQERARQYEAEQEAKAARVAEEQRRARAWAEAQGIAFGSLDLPEASNA